MKNAPSRNTGPAASSGVHFRVSGRPVGKSWGTIVSIDPEKKVQVHDATQARPTAAGSDPGAITTARVAYSFTEPLNPQATPATRRIQPIAVRGCRRATRRPDVATNGPTKAQ